MIINTRRCILLQIVHHRGIKRLFSLYFRDFSKILTGQIQTLKLNIIRLSTIFAPFVRITFRLGPPINTPRGAQALHRRSDANATPKGSEHLLILCMWFQDLHFETAFRNMFMTTTIISKKYPNSNNDRNHFSSVTRLPPFNVQRVDRSGSSFLYSII